MNAVLKLAEALRRMLEWIALASGWLLVVMACVTTFDVVAVGNADATQLHRSPPPADAASGVIPIGIPHADMLPVLNGEAQTPAQIAALIFNTSSQTFVRGQRCLLKTGSRFQPPIPQSPNGSSCEGPLDLPGQAGGAAKYGAQLLSGVGGSVSIGDRIATEPGNMVGPTRDGVNARCDADPGSVWDNTQPFSLPCTQL